MKYFRILLALAATCSGMTLHAQSGVNVDVNEGLVSIEASQASLGSLLSQVDARVGTRSTVPTELRGRTVSISLERLALDRAIRKVFAGLGLDYALVANTEIVVLGESQQIPLGVPTNAISVPNRVEPPVRSATTNTFQQVDTPPTRDTPDNEGGTDTARVLNRSQVFSSPFGVPPGVAGNGPTSGGLPSAIPDSSPIQGIFANAPSILDLNQFRVPPGQARSLPGMPVGPPTAPPPQ